MPSVTKVYSETRVTERQLARLFAIAYGTKQQPGALGGNKRDKANQLWEIVQRYGYDDWDCVDQDAPSHLWLKLGDYEQIIGELRAMRGGL